ncbi:PKD domain-containing protein, partial [Lentimicrobium sp.]|uniref:PKD domain-containing protein n=1 Tax=Lentimicrobium sp. TaxID=2034841 RepID=UPI00345E463E
FAVNQFEVQFTNRSGCASQFLWEFGDGTTSADENPVHTYPHSGAFQGSLTAWNDYGADTRDFTVNIVIQSTGEPLHEKIRIYPNPANDLLYIDAEENLLPLHLEIINSQGMTLRTEILKGKETCLTLSGLNSGVYVARMSSAAYQFNSKFMVVK